MDATQFVGRYLAEAVSLGLTESNPITMTVTVMDHGAAIRKTVVVSHVSPAKPLEGMMWINANNRQLYIYGAAGAGWMDTIDDEDPFAFTQGDEMATKAYVDSKMGQAVTMSQSIIATPVATIADLRGLNMTNVKDKQMIFVEEVGRVYAYDLQGVGQDDGGQTAVIPASGIGRWFPTTPGNLDGGLF